MSLDRFSPGDAATIRAFAPRLRAVAFDVDGTITGADHRVSPRNAAALRRCAAAGIPVVVVTGRTVEAAVDAARAAELSGHVVTFNGAITVDLQSDEWHRAGTLEPATVRAVVDYVLGVGLTCIVFTSRRMVMSDYGPGGRTRDFIVAANFFEPELGDPLDVDLDDVLKVMIVGTPKQLDAAWDGYAALAPNALRSMDDLGEICPPWATKGAALLAILERLGIDPAEVAGAGDGGNDISFLSMLGLSAAMDNGRPELKEITDLVIGHHLDDAVADLVDALLEARGDATHAV